MNDPLAYTVKEACRVAGCGTTKLYEAISNGDITPRKLGRRTLILASDLRRWLEALPTAA